MKTNKIIYIFILFILVVFLTSCKYKPKELNDVEFVKLAEKITIGDKKGKIIDFRKIDDFENGHILSSLLFDLSTKTIDEFKPWLMQYIKDGKILLFIDDGSNKFNELIQEANEYKIYYYKAGYDKLKETDEFKSRIVTRTGLDDCGC